MLTFNSKGLLVPDHNIQSDIKELKKFFVDDIKSTKREELFKKYILYSKSLKKICNDKGLTQWIDGSFVTKKTDPGDIDVVTFIDFSIIAELNLIDYKYPVSQSIFGVDAYIVKIYPSDHKLYTIYQADRAYWMSYFSKTRRNRIGNKLSKGFLEINM
jgi:hypothetical protein